MSKILLQLCTVVLAIIPVATGLLALGGVSDPLYAGLGLPPVPVLDSNLRFFGGVWLGLGLLAISCIPRIETKGTLFRAVWGMIFLGGLGRLLSCLLVGLPPVPFLFFTALEILGAPAFIYWQWRVEASSRAK